MSSARLGVFLPSFLPFSLPYLFYIRSMTGLVLGVFLSRLFLPLSYLYPKIKKCLPLNNLLQFQQLRFLPHQRQKKKDSRVQKPATSHYDPMHRLNLRDLPLHR